MIFNKDPFHRRLTMVIGASALACLILIALVMSAGPRIRDGIYDSTKLTSLNGQRLILKANQPVGKITDKQVSVTPDVPVQAIASGNAIAVTFKERLKYDTTYKVTVKPNDLPPLHYSLTTSQAAIYYMERGAEGLAGEIFSRAITGRENVLLKLDAINAFTVVDGALIVSTRSADYTTELHRFDLATKKLSPVRLPRVGTATHLQASPDRQSFGYSLTAKTYDPAFNSTIYVHDAGGKELKSPTGLDKKKIQALDWRFGPDGSIVIAQTFTNDTIVASTSDDAVPAILGQGGLGGLSFDGKKAILTDSNGIFQLDLNDNTETRLPPPSDEKDSYVISAMPFNNSNGYLMQWQSPGKERSIEHVNGFVGGKPKLFFSAEKGESIWAYRTSPNDQYLAVSTLRPGDSEPRRILRIYDMRTGALAAQMDADIISWQ